jgi:hypothetical protein
MPGDRTLQALGQFERALNGPLLYNAKSNLELLETQTAAVSVALEKRDLTKRDSARIYVESQSAECEDYPDEHLTACGAICRVID